MFNGCTLYGYSKSLPRLGVIPTSWAPVPGRPHKSASGEFRVCPRNLLCGVSLPRGGTGGMGVDERVEGASGRPTWFVFLDVDQVEQAAQFCPLVEAHGGTASFDDPNQASDEEDGVRTVIPLTVSSVDLQGDWLVHAFSPRREGPAGTEVGCPGRPPRLPRPYHPERQRRLSAGERYIKARRAKANFAEGRLAELRLI
jgi:hypothetical protein